MTNELNTYTMQDLYKQPIAPVEYLVEGLLAAGLYILGGSPKVGKSWMALQLCLAVCDGAAFLGRKTMQAEVLYLALEDGPQRLHSRALRLADTAPSGLHLCHRAAPIGQGLERQIEAQLAEYPHIRPMVLEELCEELRQRPGRGGVGAGAAVVGGRELTRNTIKSNREASFTRDFPVVGSGGVPSIFTAKVWWCW